MAEQYDNSNSFVLFKNDKGDNEKRPDYTGTITLEGGKEMNLSAWVKESKAGVAFLSGRVNEKNVNQAPSEPRKREAVAEDVPF